MAVRAAQDYVPPPPPTFPRKTKIVNSTEGWKEARSKETLNDSRLRARPAVGRGDFGQQAPARGEDTSRGPDVRRLLSPRPPIHQLSSETLLK